MNFCHKEWINLVIGLIYHVKICDFSDFHDKLYNMIMISRVSGGRFSNFVQYAWDSVC